MLDYKIEFAPPWPDDFRANIVSCSSAICLTNKLYVNTTKIYLCKFQTFFCLQLNTSNKYKNVIFII